MTYDETGIQVEQKRLCAKFTTDFLPSPMRSKLGIALPTLNLRPLNGLRHVPEKGTNGWYIWGGELSTRPDFFEPLHVEHLTDRCPQILKFMGLPAGYRFLLAGDHIDVWFDVSLLGISAS